MANVLNIYNKIDLLRERFHQSARKKESLLTLIGESEVSEQVYNSNAIENSTLSLDETEKILLRIDLDRFISERELFEAKNLALVVAYINQEAKQKELTLNMILFLHKMLISNIQDEIAGRFRQENEWVRVANHIACDPKHIVEKLEDMFITYDSSPTKNIIKRIAAFHLEFEYIHPFVDGNGRIGRVLNNYLLIREGYVPINIKFIDRSDYYDAFREYDENRKSAIMEEIIGKAITNSYHKRLAYLEELEIVTLNTFAKRNNISHSNLINKAKRQTIEAFSEKGIWKIGIPRP
ncbi:MAG: Fic family protein [Candidatus Marinimicrobia bacterium]|jgi:Fic family protein|nr:Fic family protein [Candidatus Neomarinimicrobiota bacterium]MBT3675363.1 Fic family protein [Candidatus Neomarinimicrobiota bacterium]MBT3762362.1 Fic family protein [Candidatus Neomarinimicrobiota bacterium]MBT4068137.1 Fic family protein [Candidatus Neomarinimicrobiota bacterium]MBT4271028.1 Fic family protein [Candidatus Neomarinimicrobiota bacterium]